MNREGHLQTNVTIALIMDCPTITVHTGKCHKALIASEAAFSLVRYSTYQIIDNHLKKAIQTTSIHLNTVDGSPMTTLGITTLQLWIADFKFSHNFIICDRLPDTEILFGIYVQKKFALSYTLHREKNCYIQKEGRYSLLTLETVNRRHLVMDGFGEIPTLMVNCMVTKKGKNFFYVCVLIHDY